MWNPCGIYVLEAKREHARAPEGVHNGAKHVWHSLAEMAHCVWRHVQNEKTLGMIQKSRKMVNGLLSLVGVSNPYTHTCIHAYTYTRMHTYTHAYTHTRMHT